MLDSIHYEHERYSGLSRETHRYERRKLKLTLHLVEC